MKRCLAIFLLLIASTHLQAQNSTRDSIRVNLERLNRETQDSSRAKLLYYLSYYYQFYDLDSALLTGRKAFEISDRINFEKGRARSLSMMAGAYNKLGNYTKALEYYLQGLQVLEKLKDPEDICRAQLNIALLYSSKKETEKALEYAFLSDSIATQHNFTSLLPYIKLDIGNMYTDKNELDSALKYTRLALDSSMAQGNGLITGTVFNNLGNIFFRQGRYPIAVENYYKAIPFLNENEDYNNLAECYLGLAKAYDKQEVWDSAKLYGSLSYRLSTDNEFLQQRIYSSLFLTELFKKHAIIDSAFAYQQTYMALKDSFDNNEKLRELHNLTMNEQLRQEELAIERSQMEKERKVKLQLLLIGLLIPLSFLVSAIISKKKVSKRMVELSGIFSLLFLFEYITLLLHPVVAEKSGHSPIIEIVIFVILAAILSPAHHKIEHWFVTHLTRRHHKTIHQTKEEKGQKEEPPLPGSH